MTIGQTNRVVTGLATNGIAVLEEPNRAGLHLGQPTPSTDLEIVRVDIAMAGTPPWPRR